MPEVWSADEIASAGAHISREATGIYVVTYCQDQDLVAA